MMLQCEECESWRLLYSQKRLALKECTELEKALDDFVYSCDASLQDLDLPGKLGDVEILLKNYTGPHIMNYCLFIQDRGYNK